MAVAGSSKPSARCTIVRGVLVVDSFMMRHSDVISTPAVAIDLLRGGQVAYVQTYGDNLKIVRAAFVNSEAGEQ